MMINSGLGWQADDNYYCAGGAIASYFKNYAGSGGEYVLSKLLKTNSIPCILAFQEAKYPLLLPPKQNDYLVAVSSDQNAFAFTIERHALPDIVLTPSHLIETTYNNVSIYVATYSYPGELEIENGDFSTVYHTNITYNKAAEAAGLELAEKAGLESTEPTPPTPPTPPLPDKKSYYCKIKDLFPLSVYTAGSIKPGLANGIFDYLLDENTIYDWATETLEGVYTAKQLNTNYYARSAQKYVAPWINDLAANEGVTTTEELYQIIRYALDGQFGKKWNDLYATLKYEYNPIENYNMVEEMEDDETVHAKGTASTTTNNLTHAKTGTESDAISMTDTLIKTGSERDTLEKTGTETDKLSKTGSEKDTLTKSGTEKHSIEKTGKEKETDTPTNRTTTRNDSVWGFNSSDPVPATRAVSSETGYDTKEWEFTNRKDEDTLSFTTRKDETEKTFTDREDENVKSFTNRKDETTKTFTNRQDQTTRGGSDTTTFNTSETDTGTQSIAHTGSDTDTRNYKLTRSGNIGVTTTQQMIQAQREVAMWEFFSQVLADIDSLLTLSVY